MGATTSKDHPRKIAFAQAIGQAIRCKHEPDLEKVAKYLVERRKMKPEEAKIKAKSRSMAPYVRTYSRDAEETIADVEKVVSLHERLDATGRLRGELPLLQPDPPQGKKGPRGARGALRHLTSCLRKGCGADPQDVDGMYV